MNKQKNSPDFIKTTISYMKVLTGAASARALAFLTSILLGRKLGPEGFGEFSLFTATMLIVWQIPQAFDSAFIRYAKGAESSQKDIREYLAAATRMKCLFAMLMFIAAGLVPFAVKLLPAVSANSARLVSAGLICGSMLSFIGSVSSVMRINERYGQFSMLQAAFNFSVFICTVIAVFIFARISVNISISIYLTMALTCSSICLFITIKTVGNPFIVSQAAHSRMLQLSKWILMTTTVFYLFSRVDIFFMSYDASYSQVGIYSAASQIVLAISILTSSMSAIVISSSVQAVTSPQAFKVYIKESFLPITAILLGIIILYIAAPYCFTYIFTPAYAPASKVLRILLFGYAMYAIYTPLSFIYYALELPKIRFGLELLKLLTAMALLAILIPRYGINGAALAISLSMGSNCLISAIVILHITKKHFINLAATQNSAGQGV